MLPSLTERQVQFERVGETEDPRRSMSKAPICLVIYKRYLMARQVKTMLS